MTIDKYVIYLVKCALKNEQPKEKPENLLWNKIFSLANKHMTANIIWYSVSKLTDKPDSELWKKWTEIKNKAVVKDITQRNEYKKLLRLLIRNKYAVCPLKGFF